MSFVYHLVPDLMSGTMLYPLNVLQETHPDMYAAAAAKYAERMHVMEYRVPTLDCRWNDVLHLTAVDPQDLMRALVETGWPLPSPLRFFRIPVSHLTPALLTVYLYTRAGRQYARIQPPDDEFVPYDPTRHTEYARIPAETRDYYREFHTAGKKPLRFRGIAHVLYKGPIDISRADIVTAQP